MPLLRSIRARSTSLAARRLTILASALTLAACTTPDLRNVGIVEPGVLVRAGNPSALGLAALRDRYGVQTVINLMDTGQGEEMTEALALGLDYVPLPTATFAIERNHLVTILAAIRQAEAEGRVPVLVHCRSGQDRTGTAVGLFRTVEQDWTEERAVDEMQRYRHWTHEVLFPHLVGIVEDGAAFEDAWTEAVERTGSVPVIRPPMAWRPSARPESGMPADTPLIVQDEPGIF